MAAINGVGRFGVRSYVAPTSSLSSIITNGLLLSLDAGNSLSYSGTGTTWTDMSGNGNNGTLTNGTSYSSENGGVMVFDGVNDYVSRSNFIGNSTTFTVCHWINLSSNQTTRTIFSNYTGSGWVTGISDSSVNVIKFYLGGAHLYATYPLEINKWYYVCVTYNNGNPTIYINGVLNSTTTGNISFGSLATNNDIGRLGDGRQYFNGKISNLQTYNRALSASEILQNFDGTKTRFGYASYTTRTAAFATATGITDTTILNALNTFDTGLISNGLDTKMKALYPFVGGTANTHKYNFMDARDTDSAFRLQFNGGWVHSSTGVLPNGTNAYADTYYNLQYLNQNNTHLSIYNTNNYTPTQSIDMGAFNETSVNGAFIATEVVTGISRARIFKNALDYPLTDNRGYFLANSNSTNSQYYINNVNRSTIANSGTFPLDSRNIYIGALNGSQGYYFANGKYTFSSIGNGLTDAEASTLYTLTQALQTSLSRQV